MGYKCTFMDNDVYYAKDVNAMFANLTTAGIVLAGSGNILSDLNEANSQAVSEGVTKFADSCKVTKENGIYKIGEGVCFMPDGSCITFDEEGYEISPIPNTFCYVYLKRNDTKNTIDVIVSNETAEEGSVMLAEILENGEIKDKRQYAQAKVRLNTEAEVRNFDCILVGGEAPVTLDLQRGDFSRIIINTVKFPNGAQEITESPKYHNALEIKDGTEIVFGISRGINFSTDVLVYALKDGSKLTLRLEQSAYGYPYTVNFDVL